KMATVVAGRDPDDPKSLAGYREMVDKLLTKIPRQFNARPATPRQIHWWYRRRWSLGALSEPFPHEPGGPDRLTSTDFASLMPADFDGGDQMSRRDHRSWWRRLLPSLAPLLVIRRPKQPASYQ